MRTERKPGAGALYLELRAHGLGVRIKEGPDYPDGYAVGVRGLDRLDPEVADSLRRRTTAGKALLRRLLLEPDINALVIVAEGVVPDSEGVNA